VVTLFGVFSCNRFSIFISCFNNVKELLNPLVMWLCMGRRGRDLDIWMSM
jgi:hypothetical protein